MHCGVYFAHQDSAPQYLMAMQFYIWPIKFTFDWPFCPSNNLPLYCTLPRVFLFSIICKGQKNRCWLTILSLMESLDRPLRCITQWSNRRPSSHGVYLTFVTFFECIFLNQARVWFIEIAFVHNVSVCVSTFEGINNVK